MEIFSKLHTIPVVKNTSIFSRCLSAEMHIKGSPVFLLEKYCLLGFYVFARRFDERLHFSCVDIDQINGLVASYQNEWECMLELGQGRDEIFLNI